MPDPTTDPVRLLEHATPSSVLDTDYHDLARRGRRRRRRHRALSIAVVVLVVLATSALAWRAWHDPPRVDVVGGPETGVPARSFPLPRPGDELPGPTSPGWPIDVVHETRWLPSQNLAAAQDAVTTWFRAESWSDWTFEPVGPEVFAGETVAPDPGAGACAARVRGRAATCDGVLEPRGPDTPDQPMGPSFFMRPLGGVTPRQVDYRRARIRLPDGTFRAVFEAESVFTGPCRETGYVCPGTDGDVVEVTRVVADAATWVPLLVEITVDEVRVIDHRVVAWDGEPFRVD